MSSFREVYEIVKDINGPPGIIHPLLVENYAWVDERLREMYNSYALTKLNCDEYEAAGLLKENWAWIDDKLEEMCAIADYDCIQCPVPIRWYGEDSEHFMLLEENEVSVKLLKNCNNKLSESDISDISEISYDEEKHKRLPCQSPIPTGKYVSLFTNPFCNLDCERYNQQIQPEDNENVSVGSFVLETGCGEFNCFNDSVTSLSTYYSYDSRFENSLDSPLSINPAPYYNNVVSDDESSYYYYYDYDCYGYDSP